MGNIKCLNCGNDITMISGSVCPNCSTRLSHVKISFLAYLGPEDSLSGYQRSYKLVLLKSLFEELLVDDVVYVRPVVERFKRYYVNRLNQGLITDKDVDERIQNIGESSLEDVFEVIKANPYNAIRKQNYLKISDESLDGVFVLRKELIDLNKTEKESLISLIKAKLRLYYTKIGSQIAEEKCDKSNDEMLADSVVDEETEAGTASVAIVYPTLEELGLSTRSYNAIRRHNIQTVEGLLEVIESGEIANIRNLGSNSINEILQVVENIKTRRVVRGTEEDASQDNVEIDVVVRYFPENKFAMFRTYCSDRGIDTVQKLKNIDFSELMRSRGFGLTKLNAIRERLQQIEVEPGVIVQEDEQPIAVNTFDKIHGSNEFLQISVLCRFGVPSSATGRFSEIGIRTFADIKREPKSKIAQVLGIQNYTKLEEALKQFEIPLIDIVGEYLKTFEQNKEFDIYVRRAEGDTLQEIGEAYNLTRERVRQHCSKFKRAVMPMILALAQGLEDANSDHYIKEEQVLSVFDNDDYDKIFVFTLRNASSYDFVGGIFFNKEHYPRAENDLIGIVSDIVGDGISLFDEIEKIESALDSSGYGFINADDFLNIVIEFNYCFYGDYIVKNKKSYAFLCAQLVEECFPDGIKYEDEDMNRLRILAKERFGDLDLPDNDRSLWTRLCTHLVQRGRATYISPKKVFVDKDLMVEMKAYVDSSPLNEIFFKEIYAEFEGVLMMTTNIDNASFLHGVFAYYYPHEYIYSRDSLSKRDVEETQTMASRIREVLLEAGHPLRKDEIMSHFPGLAESVLFNAIIHSEDIMQWEYNYYNCMGNIKRNESAEQILKTTLQVLLSENQGYCSESILYESTKDKLRDYFDENKICNAQNLFYLTYMLFDGKFSFRRPHIASVGRFKSLNVKGILIELLGSPDRLYYDDFMDLTTKLMIPVVTAGMVFTEIEKEYIRISQNEYLRKSCVSIDTSDIEIIKGLVESYAVDEWYLPLQKFAECEERLPNRLEINEFVMESITTELNLGWHVVQPQIKDRRYQKGIMVRNDNSIMTYDTLVAGVLLSKGISELSEAQLLSFMQIHQLAGKVIPKELFSSSHFEVDDNGTIKVK